MASQTCSQERSRDLPARVTRPAQSRTRAGWTQRRGEERRRQLIDAACALLEEHELDEISLEDVARRAGIPVASAYHFYADRNAVFAAAASRFGEAFAELLQRPYPSRSVESWEDVMVAAIRRAVRYYSAHPAARRLLIDGKVPPEIKLADRVHDQSLGALLETIVDRHFRLPQFPDRSMVFYHAVEIVDLMFLLSMMRWQRITPKMVEHAIAACLAYLRVFLPGKLPRNTG